jgi:hypothetical protein
MQIGRRVLIQGQELHTGPRPLTSHLNGMGQPLHHLPREAHHIQHQSVAAGGTALEVDEEGGVVVDVGVVFGFLAVRDVDGLGLADLFDDREGFVEGVGYGEGGRPE